MVKQILVVMREFKVAFLVLALVTAGIPSTAQASQRIPSRSSSSSAQNLVKSCGLSSGGYKRNIKLAQTWSDKYTAYDNAYYYYKTLVEAGDSQFKSIMKVWLARKMAAKRNYNRYNAAARTAGCLPYLPLPSLY